MCSSTPEVGSLIRNSSWKLPKPPISVAGTGLFVWNPVLSPISGEWDLADPWIVLAAIATVTQRIRLGAMVTPLPRRRVIMPARETVTLDRLSNGRLIPGLGIGGDRGRELSAFGETTNARRRARVLEEGTAVLTDLWAGEMVCHTRSSATEETSLLMSCVLLLVLSKNRIPIWFGTERIDGSPIVRAARYDGIFPSALNRMASSAFVTAWSAFEEARMAST